MKQIVAIIVSVFIFAAFIAYAENAATPKAESPAPADSNSWRTSEKHLKNIKQLTFGGENAEAYFSHDAKQLTFQSSAPPASCDQIYVMNSDGSGRRLVSTGKGRTTCSFIQPDGKRIIYASTHAADSACPPSPDYSMGYVWALYPGYEIYSVNPDGSDLKNISNSPRYDAEAVYSPDGKKIVFTSLRSGDLEIYTMNPDGSDLKQLTHEMGYDG